MAGFLCCLWWFVAGVLLGWLLNWLFDKFFRRGGNGSDSDRGPSYVNNNPAPRPIAPSMPVPPAAPLGMVSAPLPSPIAATVAAATSVAGAATYGFGKLKTSEGYDNFEIIEGIGPKINSVMHAAGIHTFAALAATDIPAISKILDAAGPHFKLANPETWAQQSGMCAAGQWEKLKALQDELVAGVSIQKDNA